MEPTKKTRGKRVDEKRKLGTTVLVRTDNNINLFKEQYPSEFKTPGEVIDLMAGLCLRVNPDAAAELYEFCVERADDAERAIYELKGGIAADAWAGNLRAKRDYYRELAAHLSHFVPKGRTHPRKGFQLPMKRIRMRGETYAIVPDDWIVINEDAGKDCDYAFVLEARNSERYGIPHFVYLSESEVCSNEEVIEAAAEVWPKMQEIRDMQVEPAYDKYGVILNAKEWSEAPTIGIFPIADSSSFSYGEEAPYGAMIYRH